MPKLEVIAEIMSHFDIDFTKFVNLDMQKHSVSTGSTMTKEQERQRDIDFLKDGGLNDSQEFAYLEDLGIEELRKLYIKQVKANRALLVERGELFEKYVVLQEIKS